MPRRTGRSASLDPDDPDVALVARRLVVDHCLYGVDRNPLAAEMAKLSLWLMTMAKERPFTFLDHADPGRRLAARHHEPRPGPSSSTSTRSAARRLHRNLLAVTDAIEPLVDEALEWIRAMRDVEPITVTRCRGAARDERRGRPVRLSTSDHRGRHRREGARGDAAPDR